MALIQWSFENGEYEGCILGSPAYNIESRIRGSWVLSCEVKFLAVALSQDGEPIKKLKSIAEQHCLSHFVPHLEQAIAVFRELPKPEEPEPEEPKAVILKLR